MHPSIVHRALVTYSDERTGEIRVKIPAVTGASSEVNISYVGRQKINNVWVVPSIGEQIIVSADDSDMTNVFWLHTDAFTHTKNQRNYIQVLATGLQFSVNTFGQPVVFDSVTYNEGIHLVNNGSIGIVSGTKIAFDYEGIYNIQLSVQWVNTSTQIRESAVWVNYNGSSYPNSSTFNAVTERHGSIPGTAVTTVNLLNSVIKSGDYIELMWASSATTLTINSLSAVPPFFPEGTDAFVPVSPGVILTVTQVA